MKWHKIFKYENGKLLWVVKPCGKVRVGDEAGWLDNRGHLRVEYRRKKYGVHRVIWEMHHGSIPDGYEIDHINGVKDNNQIENLRLATKSQNQWNSCKQKNNTSGFKGVYWHKLSQKWSACIQVFGKLKHLGLFLTKEDAYNARKNAEKFYHGEFAPTEERKSYVAS